MHGNEISIRVTAGALDNQADMRSHRVLTVPGFTGSGPDHWQSHWERQNPDYVRVEQEDWERPDRDAWVAALDRHVGSSDLPCVLLAHSLGCITAAHWAVTRGPRSVVAAFLVAPADADDPAQPYSRSGFAPVPLTPLPFPALVVASRNDPIITPDRARHFAAGWGAALHDAGDAGHLATKDGYGPWPEGRRLLSEFLDRVLKAT